MHYRVTSPATPNYNCIAWAAEDDSQWWEPDPWGNYYWPEGIPRICTIDALVKVFLKLGYELCADLEKEDGFKKVALYADDFDNYTHAARQLENGFWTSKIGRSEDIEHEPKTLDLLVPEYGNVRFIMKKKI